MFNWVVLLFIGLSSPAGSSGLYAPPGARAGGLGDTFTAMAIGGFATRTMLTKNSFLDEINKQYVITARAKGLSLIHI